MKMLEEERGRALAKLGLPDNVLKIAKGKEVPKLLQDHCRTLKYYNERDVKLPEQSFIPLWEGHSSITGYR